MRRVLGRERSLGHSGQASWRRRRSTSGERIRALLGGRGHGGWAWGGQPFRWGQNWCLLVAKPTTLPVSIRPNLNFADSISHLPRSCEKHSMTFIQSEQLYSSAPQIPQGRRACHSCLLRPHARARRAHTHTTNPRACALISVRSAHTSCVCVYVHTHECPHV